VIRWLALILLVLSIHPPGPGAPGSSPGRTPAHAAAWALASGLASHVTDWSVDAYDDDDQDDSAPPAGSTPAGSDDDVLCAGIDGRIGHARPSATQRALSRFEGGLGPARGHPPDTARPPRAA
jgi:hypothetical protein